MGGPRDIMWMVSLEKMLSLKRMQGKYFVESLTRRESESLSTLIKRDIDILKKINEQSRAIVSFSFSSVNDRISAFFEPGVPLPAERLKTISLLRNEGISCGMFLLPVIPFITDTPALIEESVRKAREAGASFIIFGGMTLKEGKQKNYFFNAAEKKYPETVTEYRSIYKENKWGAATGKYYSSINQTFNSIADKYKMPKRLPFELYSDILSENDLVVVILEHIDYSLKLKDEKSPFGYAAYSISQAKEPLSAIRGDLLKLKGIGKVSERIILEILDTGNSSYYNKLLKYNTIE